MDRNAIVPNVKKLLGPNAVKWVNYHQKYGAKSTYEFEFVQDRSKPAIGPFATDVDGNIFLDFVMHIGTLALGYNNPKIINLIKNFPIVDPDRYAGTDFIGGFGEDPDSCKIPTPSHLQQKLVEISKHFDFNKCFLINTGAEAVENAVKFCYDYKKNRGYGLTFDGAFHGRSLGSLSLNRSKTIQRKWFPVIPNIVQLPYCSCEDPCGCGWIVNTRKGKISSLRKLLDRDLGLIDSKETSFVILEPIQGEGGYNVPNYEFMKEVNEICQEHNIPIISDEIQAGLGRTGKWWAIEHFSVKPDLITSAKALRVGAVVGKEELFPKENSRISGTWSSGNALSSAVGYKTIEIIEQESLMENAEQKGKYFLKRLKELEEKYKLLSNARGLGLMLAIDFPTEKERDDVKMKSLEKGLLLLGCGYNSIRFLPPLDVTEREIDLAVGIIEEVLKDYNR